MKTLQFFENFKRNFTSFENLLKFYRNFREKFREKFRKFWKYVFVEVGGGAPEASEIIQNLVEK